MKTLRRLAWILPIGILLASSFAGPWVWPDLLPREWTTRALLAFARQWPRLVSSIGSSFLLAGLSTALSLLVSLAAAREFSRHPRPLLEAMLMLPALLPPLACLWGMQTSMGYLRLADTAPGLVLALSTLSFPYLLRSLLESYRLMPGDLIACARNLGASARYVFFRVELPLLLPGIIAGASLTFLAAWSDYLAFFLIGGGNVPGFTLFLYPFLMSSDRAMASLGVLTFVSIPLVLFGLGEYLGRRHIKRLGLAQGRGGFHV